MSLIPVTTALIVVYVGDRDALMEDSSSACPSSDSETLQNWSGTHSSDSIKVYSPSTLSSLKSLLSSTTSKVRCVGSGLSPNGLSFPSSSTTCVNLSDLNTILNLENNIVEVEAGMTVHDLLVELSKSNLTLPVLASISEQTVGGFVNVSAHGTGIGVGPIDAFVESFKIVTPGFGLLELARTDSGYQRKLFDIMLVGLGCFGVVYSYKIKVVSSYNLLQKQFVLTRKEAVARMEELKKDYKHMRMMWVPYEDCVVVVASNPSDGVELPKLGVDGDPLEPMKRLLKEKGSQDSKLVDGLGMGELRDELLNIDVLNPEWVKKVNAAEARFWKNNSGYVYDSNSKLLNFDCGGQQHVLELCFETTAGGVKQGADAEFMLRLLQEIESAGLPAPGPIEQRWSAGSSATMSPAFGEDGDFCWVGGIMYLTTDDAEIRNKITDTFSGTYSDLMLKVGKGFGAKTHWAKRESGTVEADEFNQIRKLVDPEGRCGNEWTAKVFGF
ncbi:hypothetical protein TL16_g06529 [Triparma laevis f. inornata]|uniref:FAD-binding PCMH-type domain-containing protein n=1 Tax=Triparma laevis f. inornata TaxID=1714386 RepID=A0A9W7ARH7_9STRA|nr:hypothetical protein TL16_g06529 [Triparma laevis f. inornata]